MSEFPKSGLGSWAQWRRRVKKAHELSIAIDSGPCGDDPWMEEHSKHLRGWKRVCADIRGIETNIADRKAG